MKKLKKLELDNNGLEELAPDLFTNLTSLQTINLHNNKLTQLPTTLFTGLANLTSLTLTENRLTSLPAGLFDPLVSLEVIKMGENVYEQFPENLFSKVQFFGFFFVSISFAFLISLLLFLSKYSYLWYYILFSSVLNKDFIAAGKQYTKRVKTGFILYACDSPPLNSRVKKVK